MKRTLSIIILILAAASLTASPAVTYSFSQVGEKCGNGSFGSFTVALGFSPEKEKPYGAVELSALIGFDRFFQGVDISLSTPVVALSNDVFSYAFSNRVLWEPTIGLLAQYRLSGERWHFGFLVSPFKFTDSSFSYEFMSPYFTFGLDGGTTWGIRVMKMTGFLGL